MCINAVLTNDTYRLCIMNMMVSQQWPVGNRDPGTGIQDHSIPSTPCTTVNLLISIYCIITNAITVIDVKNILY